MRSDGKVGRLCDSGKNLVSDYGMLFYGGKFFVGKLSLFVDDCVRDSNFSYVVKERGKINFAAFFM